jgi:integrase
MIVVNTMHRVSFPHLSAYRDALLSGALRRPVTLRSNVVTLPTATPRKRTGKKSMSRRRGQKGYIEQKGGNLYVRWRQDIPGQHKRAYRSAFVCKAKLGRKRDGKLKPSVIRKGKEIVAASGADSAECLAKAEAYTNGITFGQQAEKWLAHMKTRRSKPVAPSTIESWRNSLDAWTLPNLGSLPLALVGNKALRELVDKMVTAKLAPMTIRNYTLVVKKVVASAVNDEGDQLYPRTWNKDTIDMPKVVPSAQNTPCSTNEIVTGLVAIMEGQGRMLIGLLAGSGLRVGEALGIEIDKHISADYRTLFIRQKVRRGKIEQFLKNDAGDRDVDLHPVLASHLREYIGSRKSGLLFCNGKGKPLSQTNLLRRVLHPALARLTPPQPQAGFHAFRRYRNTYLVTKEDPAVPLHLISYWLGHGGRTMTAHYTKLKGKAEYRVRKAEEAGLGFTFPSQSIAIAPAAPSSNDVPSEMVIKNAA